jgi:hypothetical protein
MRDTLPVIPNEAERNEGSPPCHPEMEQSAMRDPLKVLLALGDPSLRKSCAQDDSKPPVIPKWSRAQ